MRRLIVFLGVLLTVAAIALATRHVLQHNLPGAETTNLVIPVMQDRGQADIDAAVLYAQLCAACHGANFEGGSAHGFRTNTWKHGDSKAQIRRSIAVGIPNMGMPGYGATLSDDQLDGLVALIQNPPSEPAIPPPAFESRGTINTRDYEVNVEVFIPDGLEKPWAIDFADANTALITEQPGRLRWVRNGRLAEEPIEGTPEVMFAGQGGMLDVAFDPSYGDGVNDWVYLAYSHAIGGRRGGAMTRVVRAKIINNRWTEQHTVFEAREADYLRTRHHYGTRIVFDADGMLYFAIGDRGVRDHAQQLDKPNGKMHRLHRDGSIPTDNPFVGRGGNVYESIYSFGHRNPQGIAIDQDNSMIWITEHGPRGGDELNLVRPALNYGWPIITYGINYNGSIITEETQREGMEQPTVYWTPSTAVCGLDLYTDGPFERWRGNLFSGGLAAQELRRIVIEDDRVIHQEIILKDRGRVRDVCVGPDGAIYVVVNGPDEVIRLTYGRRSPQ